MANFSERIKELRHKNKMTQEKLGKVIEVGPDSIYIYEKGKAYPEVRNLIILANGPHSSEAERRAVRESAKAIQAVKDRLTLLRIP